MLSRRPRSSATHAAGDGGGHGIGQRLSELAPTMRVDDPATPPRGLSPDGFGVEPLKKL